MAKFLFDSRLQARRLWAAGSLPPCPLSLGLLPERFSKRHIEDPARDCTQSYNRSYRGGQINYEAPCLHPSLLLITHNALRIRAAFYA